MTTSTTNGGNGQSCAKNVRRLLLAAHYVLPLPASRKARQFHISERRYFYDLNDALTRLLPKRDAEKF